MARSIYPLKSVVLPSEDPASVDDPPTDKQRAKGLGYTPPQRQEERPQAQEREQ